jgi:hypothetical protein
VSGWRRTIDGGRGLPGHGGAAARPAAFRVPESWIRCMNSFRVQVLLWAACIVDFGDDVRHTQVLVLVHPGRV